MISELGIIQPSLNKTFVNDMFLSLYTGDSIDGLLV